MRDWRSWLLGALTIGFTVFMWGKTTEDPVSTETIQQTFIQYEEAIANYTEPSSKQDMQIMEYFSQLENEFALAEMQQTLYNRLIRPAYYLDKAEQAELELIKQQVEALQASYLHTALPEKIDFQQVLDGQLVDKAVSVAIKGKTTKIDIDGQVKQYPLKAFFYHYYWIKTGEYTYYWEEPDYNTAHFTDNRIQLKGDNTYTFTMTQPSPNW